MRRQVGESQGQHCSDFGRLGQTCREPFRARHVGDGRVRSGRSGGTTKGGGGCHCQVPPSADQEGGSRHAQAEGLQAAQGACRGCNNRGRSLGMRCRSLLLLLVSGPQLGRPAASEGAWTIRPDGLQRAATHLFGDLANFRCNQVLRVGLQPDFCTALDAVRAANELALVVQRNLMEDCFRRSPDSIGAVGARADGQCPVEPCFDDVDCVDRRGHSSSEFPSAWVFCESAVDVHSCTAIQCCMDVPSFSSQVGVSLGVQGLRLPSTDSHPCRIGSSPKLRSCLQRKRPLKVAGRKVTFSFAVQFWFPGPLQLSLPAHSTSVGPAACASSPRIEAVPSFSTALSCIGAPRLQQPTCSFAPFGTPFATALASGSGPALVRKAGLEGCIPNPDLGSLVGSRCIGAAGNGMLECGRPAKPSIPRFNMGSALSVLPSRAQPRPFGRRDLANANAIHSFPSAGLLAAIEGGSSAFTCLESIRGTDVRRRFHYWDDAQCAADAVGSSSLPNPAPRLLIHCLPGFPTPQVIVTQTALLRTHRAVAILYEEAPLEPWICDIPLSANIRNFLHAQAFAPTAPRHAWVRLFRAGAAFSCVVNDRPISCDVIMPPDADVVRLTAPVALQPMPAYPQADVGARQPMPPIPWSSTEGGSSSGSDAQASGLLRVPDAQASGLAYPAHPPPVLSSTRPGRWRLPWAVDCGMPSQPPVSGLLEQRTDMFDDRLRLQFTVFDVHRNARVLPLPLSGSEKAMVNAAVQATPELGKPFEYRFLRFTLERWPEPQLVIHERLPTDQVVVPIALGNPFQVCTLSLDKVAAPFAAMIRAAEACDLPKTVYQAIARGDAQLWVNNRHRSPFAKDAFRVADSAKYQVATTGPVCTSGTAIRRWPQTRVLSLPELRVRDISDGTPTSEVVVHCLGEASHCFHVDAILRPYLFSQFLRRARGKPASWHIVIPEASPGLPGSPAHVLLTPARVYAQEWTTCIVDLRRVAAAPMLPFVALDLPRFMVPSQIVALLRRELPSVAPIGRIFIDWDLLTRPVQTTSSVPVVTLIGGSRQAEKCLLSTPPVLLHTYALLSLRPGFGPAFANTQHTLRVIHYVAGSDSDSEEDAWCNFLHYVHHCYCHACEHTYLWGP